MAERRRARGRVGIGRVPHENRKPWLRTTAAFESDTGIPETLRLRPVEFRDTVREIGKPWETVAAGKPSDAPPGAVERFILQTQPDLPMFRSIVSTNAPITREEDAATTLSLRFPDSVALQRAPGESELAVFGKGQAPAQRTATTSSMGVKASRPRLPGKPTASSAARRPASASLARRILMSYELIPPAVPISEKRLTGVAARVNRRLTKRMTEADKSISEHLAKAHHSTVEEYEASSGIGFQVGTGRTSARHGTDSARLHSPRWSHLRGIGALGVRHSHHQGPPHSLPTAILQVSQAQPLARPPVSETLHSLSPRPPTAPAAAPEHPVAPTPPRSDTVSDGYRPSGHVIRALRRPWTPGRAIYEAHVQNRARSAASNASPAPSGIDDARYGYQRSTTPSDRGRDSSTEVLVEAMPPAATDSTPSAVDGNEFIAPSAATVIPQFGGHPNIFDAAALRLRATLFLPIPEFERGVSVGGDVTAGFLSVYDDDGTALLDDEIRIRLDEAGEPIYPADVPYDQGLMAVPRYMTPLPPPTLYSHRTPRPGTAGAAAPGLASKMTRASLSVSPITTPTQSGRVSPSHPPTATPSAPSRGRSFFRSAAKYTAKENKQSPQAGQTLPAPVTSGIFRTPLYGPVSQHITVPLAADLLVGAEPKRRPVSAGPVPRIVRFDYKTLLAHGTGQPTGRVQGDTSARPANQEPPTSTRMAAAGLEPVIVPGLMKPQLHYPSLLGWHTGQSESARPEEKVDTSVHDASASTTTQPRRPYAFEYRVPSSLDQHHAAVYAGTRDAVVAKVREQAEELRRRMAAAVDGALIAKHAAQRRGSLAQLEGKSGAAATSEYRTPGSAISTPASALQAERRPVSAAHSSRCHTVVPVRLTSEVGSVGRNLDGLRLMEALLQRDVGSPGPAGSTGATAPSSSSQRVAGSVINASDNISRGISGNSREEARQALDVLARETQRTLMIRERRQRAEANRSILLPWRQHEWSGTTATGDALNSTLSGLDEDGLPDE